METIKFKTNIKCSGCVAKVTPFLDEALGKENWQVDTNDPSKVLTVAGGENQEKVLEALRKAGYRAEKF